LTAGNGIALQTILNTATLLIVFTLANSGLAEAAGPPRMTGVRCPIRIIVHKM